MTSQPSQSALNAETEAGIRARDAAFPDSTWRLIEDDADGLLFAMQDRRVLLAEIDRLRSEVFRWAGRTYSLSPSASEQDDAYAAVLAYSKPAAGASPSTAEETPE